jgi:cytochrome b subunit of formate dehydrogenase
MLGGVTGVVVSQMFLSVSSMPEVQRVTLFATSASAAILLFFCMIKSWLRVT